VRELQQKWRSHPTHTRRSALMRSDASEEALSVS